jgi:hypothetical protein
MEDLGYSWKLYVRNAKQREIANLDGHKFLIETERTANHSINHAGKNDNGDLTH